MFQFPGFPSYTYVFSIWYTVLHRVCFHIRKSADQRSFAAPRSLSQLVTSFIGSWCQGIHLMLFFAWTSYSVLTFLELLEFQNMGFIFSHLKGFPFSALFCVPPYGETVVFVTLNFRKDLDLFDFAIVVSKNLLISKSFVFFLTICSFLYSFFIRFSKNKSTYGQSRLPPCWGRRLAVGRSGWTRTTDLALIRRAL